MYTIQKHKAREFILGALKYDHPLVTYINGIPKISYINKAGNYKVKNLEDICWGNIKEDYRFAFYLVINVLKIYGIKNMECTESNVIQFPLIQECLAFYLDQLDIYQFVFCISAYHGRSLIVTIKNDINQDDCGMLLFLIDPLKVMNKLMDVTKDTTILCFFEYLGVTIVKQDDELLLRYLLIGQLVNKFMIADIGCIIMDIIMDLLLR